MKTRNAILTLILTGLFLHAKATGQATADVEQKNSINAETAYIHSNDRQLNESNSIANSNEAKLYGIKNDTSTVTDMDGNVYRTVQIGRQIWMAENLRTTKYPDGTPIENGTLTTLYCNTGKYFYNYENNPDYIDNYGLLYSFSAAVSYHYGAGSPNIHQGVCPTGWHIPSVNEFGALITYLGGKNIAGGKLKETGSTHWNDPNEGASNESGFTARGGGGRFINCEIPSSYRGIKSSTSFWTGDIYQISDWTVVYCLTLNSDNSSADLSSRSYLNGYSVRCINDSLIGKYVPQLYIERISEVSQNTAKVDYVISYDGGALIKANGVCWSTSSNPDTSDNKTMDGGDIGHYTAYATGLHPDTTIYLRAYAVNSNGVFYSDELIFRTLPEITYGTIIDIENNTYKTIKIGEQTWMAENLKTTKYNDGTHIPLIEDNSSWESLSSPAYCWYKNDAASYKNVYGALYNWFTVSTNKICPSGWRVPSYDEWASLGYFLGGPDSAGGKLKEAGITHWYYPNSGATNETGFTGLPGGGRYLNPYSHIGFNGLGKNAHFWTAGDYSPTSSYGLSYGNTYFGLEYFAYSVQNGYSIRCIKDTTNNIVHVPIVTTKTITIVKPSSAIVIGTISPGGGSAISSRGICWSTSPNPDTSNVLIQNGSGIGDFTCNLTGLTADTVYYVRAYATNFTGVGYGKELSFNIHPSLIYGSVDDIDGNEYKTVKIGSQTWMTENLKTTRYNDGTPIPLVENNTSWVSDLIPAFCWYNNNEASFRNVYGALYNNYAIDSGNLCPYGWHVPSKAEWFQLENYMGGADVAGGKMKEPGTMHWVSPNSGATDFYGFTALPGGHRSSTDGTYTAMGTHSFYWSSTMNDESGAMAPYLRHDCIDVANNDNSDKSEGYSVRCLMDNDTTVPVDPEKGLIAWYPFNGNANDESGNRHHGTVYGATLTNDRFGNPDCAYRFDGKNDIISVTDLHIPSSENTINCWVKSLNPNGGNIIAKYYGYDDIEVLIRNMGEFYQIEWTIGGKYFELSAKNFVINTESLTFDMLTLVYDGNQVRFYINNTYVASMRISGQIYNNSFPLLFGSSERGGSGSSHLNGIIDDIRIYNRALNNSEITALYHEKNNYPDNPPQIPELISYDIKSIGKATAVSGGEVKYNGGAAIVARGICWSTSPNTDTTKNKTTDGKGAGTFISNLTGLFPNTTYYVRAYAINKAGVGYGNEQTFKTPGEDIIDLQNGLVAYYPFNGNANDESGYMHHGIVNGATLTSDRFGNQDRAYLFNGQDNSIDIYDFDLPSEFTTITYWVEATDTFGIRDIISKDIGGVLEILIRCNNSRYEIQWNIGGETFRLSDDDGYFIINPDNPRSDMLVLVYDGRQVRLYVNTILIASRYFSGRIINNNLRMVFGQDAGYYPRGPNDPFKGIIDDIRIYNRALDSTEIQALYNEHVYNEHTSINTPEIVVSGNNIFEVPVNIDNINNLDHAVAYQFDFTYSPRKMEYRDYKIEGTLSESGILSVNPVTNKLSIAWAGQTPLSGSGTLLNLQFKALEKGLTIPEISNFLLNTDTIRDISNRTITIAQGYGDVDGNNSVQAYDAALVLQYSVGLDPLPTVDPLPWEAWRTTVANVDGEGTIIAYDASLILQYVVGLIDTFPVEDSNKSFNTPQADINVSIEDGYIVFRSFGELYGLNVSLSTNAGFLGDPLIMDPKILSATKIYSEIYSVGLATAYSPDDNEIIMKIPINSTIDQYVALDMTVNEMEKQIVLNLPTNVGESDQKFIEIYPNPAYSKLFFRNLAENATVTIYDLKGRKIIAKHLSNNQIDISSLTNGLYIIHIKDNLNTVIRKFTKQ